MLIEPFLLVRCILCGYLPFGGLFVMFVFWLFWLLDLIAGWFGLGRLCCVVTWFWRFVCVLFMLVLLDFGFWVFGLGACLLCLILV